MGSGAPTVGAEIQEKMVRKNGGRGRRRKAVGDGKGMEIDRELLSLRSPVDSAFRVVPGRACRSFAIGLLPVGPFLLSYSFLLLFPPAA